MVFGLGKRKTVETMLADLDQVGIALRPGVNVEQLLADGGRAEIEKSGFELLLAIMGDEQFDPKTFAVLEPLTDDVWHFDTEAIEDHGAYVRIVECCRRLADGDLKFESVRDYVDVEEKTAWVEVSRDGRSERVDLKVDDDWVDANIFAKLQGWLKQSGSKRCFASHGLGQDVLLICKQRDQIEKINRATGLRFEAEIKS